MLLERLHRQLKASLSAANVSLLLLGIRNVVKADIGYTTAQLVYETTLRLPGEFMNPSSSPMHTDVNSCTSRLTNSMSSNKHVSTRPLSTNVFDGSVLQRKIFQSLKLEI